MAAEPSGTTTQMLTIPLFAVFRVRIRLTIQLLGGSQDSESAIRGSTE